MYDLDAPPLEPVPLLPDREYVGVGCHVCGTRMYGRLRDVGRRLKCPDCGNCTVLAPIKAKGERRPTATIEAYELETGNVLDGVVTFVDGFTFHCSLCHSLLAGSLTTVGNEVECPDCGRATRVPPPKDRPLVPPVSRGEDYELEANPADESQLQSSHYVDYQAM